MKNIKLILKICFKLLLKGSINVIYFSFRIFPFNQKKIVFFSTRSSGNSENLAPLIEELKKRELDWKVIEMSAQLETNLSQLYKHPKISIKILYLLATSRFFIIDDYCLPIYLIHKRIRADVIQIWHAAGAFKKFGQSIPRETKHSLQEFERQLIPIHSGYSKAIVSSKSAAKYFSEAFNLKEENVLPLGVPKTDCLFNEQLLENSTSKLKHKFSDLKADVKTVVYMPTFREQGNKRVGFKLFFDDISELYAVLEAEKIMLIIQVHPYIKERISIPPAYEKWIKINDGLMTTPELLLASNAFVTDYSSLLFDYSLLGKPMSLYMPDLAQFDKNRGFYGNIMNELPGPILESESQFFKWLTDLKSIQKDYSNDIFVKKWFDHHDGFASKRIVDYLVVEQSK